VEKKDHFYFKNLSKSDNRPSLLLLFILISPHSFLPGEGIRGRGDEETRGY
jgi:hypothetical protein